MKFPSQIHILQISFLALLSFTFLLHTLLSYTPILHHHFTTHLPLVLTCTLSALLSLFYYIHTKPNPVYLLNYSCYKPPSHRKCTPEASKSYMCHAAQLTPESVDFIRNISKKSGIGNEAYAPPFIFEPPYTPTQKLAIQDAKEGIFTSIDSLLSKTQIDKNLIDIVIVTCGSFSPSPSLSSLIVNHYNLQPHVKTYNLSGMGCSSGIISIDLAANLLKTTHTNSKYALVVMTETVTLSWYAGDNRSMLVTNCIFRVGCVAALLTNQYNPTAKMELIHSLRTHHGADDPSYHSAFQEEDDKGITGITLTKDLIRVAGLNLREHIKILSPKVLPYSEMVRYFSRGHTKLVVPDFKKAFEHMCIHTGGKAVIEQVGRVLKLGEGVTEPARMTLYRFGNTSSSLVFYELAYFEAKKRVKRGDRMWMLAVGTGFKVGSLVWKSIGDSVVENDNPWMDCIDEYPVKTF